MKVTLDLDERQLMFIRQSAFNRFADNAIRFASQVCNAKGKNAANAGEFLSDAGEIREVMEELWRQLQNAQVHE